MENDKRNKRLPSVRITETELDSLHAEAADRGMKIADFLRWRIFEQESDPPVQRVAPQSAEWLF